MLAGTICDRGAHWGWEVLGFTYRAWDNTLQKMLAIKEYYPSANGSVNRVLETLR